jgi:hypothetical protein
VVKVAAVVVAETAALVAADAVVIAVDVIVDLAATVAIAHSNPAIAKRQIGSIPFKPGELTSTFPGFFFLFYELSSCATLVD